MTEIPTPPPAGRGLEGKGAKVHRAGESDVRDRLHRCPDTVWMQWREFPEPAVASGGRHADSPTAACPRGNPPRCASDAEMSVTRSRSESSKKRVIRRSSQAEPLGRIPDPVSVRFPHSSPRDIDAHDGGRNGTLRVLN